mgnify:CR=1 FL=1
MGHFRWSQAGYRPAINASRVADPDKIVRIRPSRKYRIRIRKDEITTHKCFLSILIYKIYEKVILKVFRKIGSGYNFW